MGGARADRCRAARASRAILSGSMPIFRRRRDRRRVAVGGRVPRGRTAELCTGSFVRRGGTLYGVRRVRVGFSVRSQARSYGVAPTTQAEATTRAPLRT